MTIASLAVLRDEYYVTGILPNVVNLQTMKVFGKQKARTETSALEFLKYFLPLIMK